MIIAMMLAAAAPPVEAEALGLRLARTGTLAALLPLMTTKETEELGAQHKELSSADQQTLRTTARQVGAASAERLLGAEGRAYAKALSIDDLRVLVAQAESGPAKRLKAALPQVIGATMQSVGTIDYKKDVLAAFCAKTGKACPKP